MWRETNARTQRAQAAKKIAARVTPWEKPKDPKGDAAPRGFSGLQQRKFLTKFKWHLSSNEANGREIYIYIYIHIVAKQLGEFAGTKKGPLQKVELAQAATGQEVCQQNNMHSLFSIQAARLSTKRSTV